MNTRLVPFGQSKALASTDIIPGTGVPLVSGTGDMSDFFTGYDTDGGNLSAGDAECFEPYAEGDTLRVYVPANMQGVLLPSNTNPDNKTADAVTAAGGNPDLCTYLEIYGTALHFGQRTGNVSYRFYLGSDNTSDFSVQNGYKYNVTFTPTAGGIQRGDWWKVNAEVEVDKVPSINISTTTGRATDWGEANGASFYVTYMEDGAMKNGQYGSRWELVYDTDNDGLHTSVSGERVTCYLSPEATTLSHSVTARVKNTNISKTFTFTADTTSRRGTFATEWEDWGILNVGNAMSSMMFPEIHFWGHGGSTSSYYATKVLSGTWKFPFAKSYNLSAWNGNTLIISTSQQGQGSIPSDVFPSPHSTNRNGRAKIIVTQLCGQEKTFEKTDIAIQVCDFSYLTATERGSNQIYDNITFRLAGSPLDFYGGTSFLRGTPVWSTNITAQTFPDIYAMRSATSMSVPISVEPVTNNAYIYYEGDSSPREPNQRLSPGNFKDGTHIYTTDKNVDVESTARFEWKVYQPVNFTSGQVAMYYRTRNGSTTWSATPGDNPIGSVKFYLGSLNENDRSLDAVNLLNIVPSKEIIETASTSGTARVYWLNSTGLALSSWSVRSDDTSTMNVTKSGDNVVYNVRNLPEGGHTSFTVTAGTLSRTFTVDRKSADNSPASIALSYRNGNGDGLDADGNLDMWNQAGYEREVGVTFYPAGCDQDFTISTSVVGGQNGCAITANTTTHKVAVSTLNAGSNYGIVRVKVASRTKPSVYKTFDVDYRKPLMLVLQGKSSGVWENYRGARYDFQRLWCYLAEYDESIGGPLALRTAAGRPNLGAKFCFDLSGLNLTASRDMAEYCETLLNIQFHIHTKDKFEQSKEYYVQEDNVNPANYWQIQYDRTQQPYTDNLDLLRRWLNNKNDHYQQNGKTNYKEFWVTVSKLEYTNYKYKIKYILHAYKGWDNREITIPQDLQNWDVKNLGGGNDATAFTDTPWCTAQGLDNTARGSNGEHRFAFYETNRYWFASADHIAKDWCQDVDTELQ